MATAWITEYSQIGADKNGRIPLALEPADVDQALTYTTTTQSAAFGVGTLIVRFISTTNCHIAFGADPTATTSKQYVPAGAEVWRRVIPGHKVAAVTA